MGRVRKRRIHDGAEAGEEQFVKQLRSRTHKGNAAVVVGVGHVALLVERDEDGVEPGGGSGAGVEGRVEETQEQGEERRTFEEFRGNAVRTRGLEGARVREGMEKFVLEEVIYERRRKGGQEVGNDDENRVKGR